jgi:hypothetical protein
MILSQEQWMNLRAFKALAEAGPPGRRSPERPAMTGAPSSATCRLMRQPRRRHQPSGDLARA